MRAGFEAQLDKIAAEEKTISVEIQGFEMRIKEAEVKLKEREKDKLGTKASLAALEIELQSSMQQVGPFSFHFKTLHLQYSQPLTRCSLQMLIQRPKVGYRYELLHIKIIMTAIATASNLINFFIVTTFLAATISIIIITATTGAAAAEGCS